MANKWVRPNLNHEFIDQHQEKVWNNQQKALRDAEAPTADNPFGISRIEHEEKMIRGLTTSTTSQSVDFERIARMREAMRAPTQRNPFDDDNSHYIQQVTGVRERQNTRMMNHDFHAAFRNRLINYNSELFDWANMHANQEGVSIFEVILACAIDQMNHGDVEDREPNAISTINRELNKIERDKHG